jgi:hypothetical protein
MRKAIAPLLVILALAPAMTLPLAGCAGQSLSALSALSAPAAPSSAPAAPALDPAEAAKQFTGATAALSALAAQLPSAGPAALSPRAASQVQGYLAWANVAAQALGVIATAVE